MPKKSEKEIFPMFLFYLLYSNVIWACVISAIVAAAAVTAYFLFFRKGKKSPEDMKPSEKTEIIMGLNNNASLFADLYEPLFVLASGKTARKDWVLDSWNMRVNSLEGNDAFKAAFNNKFGDIASYKGKDKNYVRAADKLLKYISKAGVERSDASYVIADQTTAEKYDFIGAGFIAADTAYDVFVPYWSITIKFTDEAGEEKSTEIVLVKGAIR